MLAKTNGPRLNYAGISHFYKLIEICFVIMIKKKNQKKHYGCDFEEKSALRAFLTKKWSGHGRTASAGPVIVSFTFQATEGHTNWPQNCALQEVEVKK